MSVILKFVKCKVLGLCDVTDVEVYSVTGVRVV